MTKAYGPSRPEVISWARPPDYGQPEKDPAGRNMPGKISPDGKNFLFSQSITIPFTPLNTIPPLFGVDIPFQQEEFSVNIVATAFSNFAFVDVVHLYMEEGAGAGGRVEGLGNLQRFISQVQQPAAVQPFPVPLPLVGAAFTARGKVAVKLAAESGVVGSATILVQAYPGTPREYIFPLRLVNNRDAEIPKFCRFLYGFPTAAATTLVFANSGLARPLLDLGGRPIPIPVDKQDNLVRLGGVGGDASLGNVLAVCYG